MKIGVRLLYVAAPVCFALALFASGFGQRMRPQMQRGGGSLGVGNPGASLEGRSTLIVAFPIVNKGEGTVRNVRVAGLRVAGGRLVTPREFPVVLGDIGPESDATVFATFAGSFSPGKSYVITVTGNYGPAGRAFTLTQALRIPPASPGAGRAHSASTKPNKVSGGKYPHAKPGMEHGMNEDHGRKVPTGTIKKPPTMDPETGSTQAPRGDDNIFAGLLTDLPGVSFHNNDSLGFNGNTIAEPSGAAGGGVTFVTANAYAAYSTNNGSSFTQLDPTTIFPNGADGGFCCDQIVLYCSSIDRFVWLMQFRSATDAKGNVRNRYRLAAASPTQIKNSGGTSWTYWDFTTGLIGITNGWLDYPDMSVGDNSLYFSYDEVGVGRATIRCPLKEIAASATIHFWYTDPNNGGVAYGGHLTQDTGDEIFWSGHNSNTSMRVFSWKESSNTYFWRDVTVGAWPNGAISSTSPDGKDWLNKLNNFPGQATLGSCRVRRVNGRSVNQVWFAWTGAKGSGFKQAQVQWVACDRNNNFNVVDQHQIWNSAYAFAYPALATNSKNEVGLSLEYGGPSDQQNHVVGFWGDYIVYITTSSNVGTTRFGDYVSIRKDAKNSDQFDAYGYGLVKTGGSTVADVHSVNFGR